ncbi:DUF1501 domain-containing protein [Methylocystis sp. WRRC1]|uniref:DUF1501 domain-containing protein n=1 Tax=Methylocystis sp. WRRC1 TaxID=1732014 RepID=UPI001D140E21|nr:DUF1501 domain-containing protein [Methylocystis sp. WRRC1]MCC3244761.1 DUF1501 domain-containing protein [Methylocystis sp. WRRC1]
MRLHRRDVIKGLAALGPATATGRVWAAPKADGRLLIVFLRGAYDAANIVIPVSSSFYYAARPTLAIPRPDPASGTNSPATAPASLNSALPLDSDWGLHPALRQTIFPLYAKAQVAFVPFAGTDDVTRSHFETQDTIELGQNIDGERNFRSGFMARLAAALTGVRPIAFTDQAPLIFQGGEAIPNIAINMVGKSAIDERQAQLITSMYDGLPVATSVREGFRVRDGVYNALSDHMMDASRGAVSPKGFELSARRIGRLMREQFNLAFVEVGGWDTHVNQGGATGYLADRIAELGRGLTGFMEEIGPGWSDTVVVVISEFGRTFRENGNRGTDHGHGSVYWVLGGGIKGGRIAGEQTPVDEAHLFQNRDYPVLTDYRALLGGLLARMYGFDRASLEKIFPATRPADINLL